MVFFYDDFYMYKPSGCIAPYKEHLIYKPKRLMYELKQSPCAWYSQIDSHLHLKDMTRMQVDPYVYYFRGKTNIVILALYINDLLIISSNQNYIHQLKKTL